MKHRNNHFAVGYWSLIRRGRPTPDQSDVDPKALKRLLPVVFLLDARHSTFVYRLAGTNLCERYGGELKGRDFLGQWDRESRTRLPALMKESLSVAMPLCLTSVATTADCRMMEIETVLMPVTFNADSPERFLGVAQALTDTAPLISRSIAFERLVSAQLVREEECVVVNETPLPPVAPRPQRGSRTSRGHHLKLVVSQSQPALGAEKLFVGNDALAALVAKCEAEPGRFRN